MRGREIRLAWAALIASIAVAACGGTGADDPPQRSERERDSLIGQSRLPGAAGVRGALSAQDSAAARSARLDSIANDNPQ